MDVRARAPRLQALARVVPPLGFVPLVWCAGWITAFADGAWTLGLPMLLLTGPVSALGWRWRRAAKRSRKQWIAEQRAVIAVPPVPVRAESPSVALERRIAASVIRAESSAARMDADAQQLVHELADRLGALLVRVRQPEVDAAVRHDAEAIVSDHLPAVLDAYLSLPSVALRTAGPDGTSPADRLRAHLLLLSEGAAELEQAVVRADLSRQQRLGRFLDAKFRRSDLDL